MPDIGQTGSVDAGTFVGSRKDPAYQLAMLVGIMAGDRYNTPPSRERNAAAYQAQERSAMPSAAPVRKQPEQNPAQPTTPTGSFGPTGSVPPPNEGGFVSRLLTNADRYLGIPYVYGGTNPQRGLDCSGFVQRVFADMGIALPRVTYDQVKAGVAINDRSQLQAGDLLFFTGDGNRTNGHVGIYLGNGIMIDAPHTGANVGHRRVNWDAITAMRRVNP